MSFKGTLVLLTVIFISGAFLGAISMNACTPAKVVKEQVEVKVPVEVPINVVKEIPGPVVERIKIVTKEVEVSNPAIGEDKTDQVVFPPGTLGRASVTGSRTLDGWNGSAACQLKTPSKDWFTIFQSDFTLKDAEGKPVSVAEVEKGTMVEPTGSVSKSHRRAFGAGLGVGPDGPLISATFGKRLQDRTRLFPQWIEAQAIVPATMDSGEVIVGLRWEF